MDHLERKGSVNIYGRLVRKDDPLVASWVEGVKDSLEKEKQPPTPVDSSLVDVIVEFIRMLLCRLGKA